jgi:alkyl sulfatase BDS1-like metallo-beta-lactamase superfamily hydrolase
MYTLRGTEPRWAFDYIDSLNKVLSLKPEIMLPSHGRPVMAGAEVTRRLTQYRDAIQYVHDEVVKGMDVYTLMAEIHLPRALDVGESYGKLTWSIRGIYEGYAGWFDMNPTTMYETPPPLAYADVVRLAGGPDAVAKLAIERVSQGEPAEALRLTDMALAADVANREALEARLKALEALREACRDSNERGWLEYGIGVAKGKLTAAL